MKIFLAMFLFVGFSQISVAGDVSILCRTKSVNECKNRVGLALTAIGCQQGEILCQESKDASICSTNSENCEEPHADLVSTTTCFSGSKVNLSKYDRNLSLTWTMGFFRSYVKHICKR